MEMMAQCKQLARRIRSFFVINLDFYFFNDNVYDFGKKNLIPMFKLICDEDDSRRNIADKSAAAQSNQPSPIE